MAQQQDTNTPRKRGGPMTAPGKRKSCSFCQERVDEVDYTNTGQLRRCVSERGRIRSPRLSGACRKHQRQVALSVKRAREIALLPSVSG